MNSYYHLLTGDVGEYAFVGQREENICLVFCRSDTTKERTRIIVHLLTGDVGEYACVKKRGEGCMLVYGI